jgi:hypothetical protein
MKLGKRNNHMIININEKTVTNDFFTQKNLFERFLLKENGFTSTTKMTDEEKKTEFEWIEKYGLRISDIISENENIKELILNNKFEEAAPLVMAKLSL